MSARRRPAIVRAVPATSRSSSPVLPTEGTVDTDLVVDSLVADRTAVRRGRRLPRRDGPEKLTGRARFTDDIPLPGAWRGVTIRSTQPRATLLGVDLDPDFDWSSVVVVTAADIPGENVVHLMVDDQPALVPLGGEIHHVAEPIALVAAPDLRTARAAMEHLRVRTEALPPVLDPLQSTKAFARYEIVKGAPEAAFGAADIVIEGTYRVGHQEQLYLEPQAMLAVPGDDGGVTLRGSLQCPHYVHAAVARALGLEPDRVVVVQAVTGGGFGGKEEYPSILAIHAALLARKTGRPVRIVYDRQEDIVATTKRHPAVVHHRTGVSHDGRLLAPDVDIVMDGGAYSTVSPVVLSRAALHAGGPYACPNVRIRARSMATNMPPSGAFRGFGAPQAEFAAEMQVNRVAEALGASPAGLRRRWAYRVGDTTPTGQLLRESVGIVEAIDRAVAASGFDVMPGPTTGWAEAGGAREVSRTGTAKRARGGVGAVVHGIGLAAGWHGAGFTGSGEARLASVAGVELLGDGTVRVLSGGTELGQGSATVLPQLAAEVLRVDPSVVVMGPIDTSLVPDSGPTVASRTTMVIGGLVVRAAQQLRSEVEDAMGLPFDIGRRAYAERFGPTRIDERFEGYPDVRWDDATYRGDAYPCFSWAAVVARVAVDRDTGEVEVTSVVSADDVGRAVNPTLAEGQIEGGTLQAVGYATIEEMKVADGRFLNDRFATYVVPTAVDAPDIEAILVENPFSAAPHGAKGLGELPMDVPAAAVVAAIHDAVGVWIDELPATPERILAALGAGDRPGAIAGAADGSSPDAGDSVDGARR